jgi:hypothetical protein
MDKAYFVEKCAEVIEEAWTENPSRAVHAVTKPKMSKAWDKLPQEEKDEVIHAMYKKFGQDVILGTSEDIFYYVIVSRLAIIGKLVSIDFDKKKAVVKLIRQIVDGVKGEEVKMANGSGSQPVFSNEAYIEAMPQRRKKSRIESNVTVSMKIPMFYKYMQHIGNSTPFSVNPMPAIQLLLSPPQFTSFSTTFPELENDGTNGWWRSTVCA